MKEILKKIKNFFAEYPEYVYLLIGIISLVLFIGLLKNKNWAIDPSSGNQRMYYNTFGHNAFKKYIGIIYVLGMIAGFGCFFLYLFTK